MNTATIPILVALGSLLILGGVVFQSNPKRRVNQAFLLLAFCGAAWLCGFYFAFTAHTPLRAALGIRAASAAAALILAAFNILRLSIRHHDEDWKTLFRRCRSWLVATVLLVIFCQTPYFLQAARVSPGSPPDPIYDPAAKIYGLYLALAVIALVVAAVRDLRQTRGGERAELGFVLIGGVATLGFTVALSVVLRRYIDPSIVLWFAPFRVVFFCILVAYGISTRKIMEVGTVFRRVLSYGLLAAYLLAVYAVVWWLVSTALHSSVQNSHTIAHIAAAIVIAFAMAPARGISQRLAERLFISSHHLDFRKTVSKAAEILSSVTTLQDLLRRFADTIAEAVDTERVVILLHSRDGYMPRYVTSENGATPIDWLKADGPIAAYLQQHREPIVLDELRRIRQTTQILMLASRMRHLRIAVAMPIFSRDDLKGIMLLGPRKSGRIYSSVAQEALQVSCGQLAVAIDNAELFTEVQNAKIYNETLLQNLTTGVIAAGTDDRITVFNNEAAEITGLKPQHVLEQSIDLLPDPLRGPLRETIRTGQSQQDCELILRYGDRGIVVRASTSIFHGEDRQVLGALMVLTDITALKRLELQIRRSDRLASLGTLSAGMAHEIKNPLVSIKTFAQLLPERYQDSDFRETFSNLIGHEIDRIDSLVNQLLRFARPTKPHLKPLHVHETLEKSLLLVGHRLYQKDIKLTRSWGADVDTIRADADQLEQVFLNFFINAMDAMKNGGELSVTTEVAADEHWVAALAHSNGDGAPQEVLRVSIRDTGEGIRGEDLPHVFDPFFTTKDYGTGLGLSVVHGIIQEHGGQIEVESELSKGTAFHILLPLVRFNSEVAAA